jgi:hypothetical protein
VIDEFTREALAIRVARRLDSNHVIEVLADLCVVRGVPEHIRSDQVRSSLQGGQGMDRCRRRQDGLHREEQSLGERLRGKLHVWTAPAVQGRRQLRASVGCVHVYGLFARPGSWPLALMEFADRGHINGSRWNALQALRAASILGSADSPSRCLCPHTILSVRCHRPIRGSPAGRVLLLSSLPK